VTGCVCEKIAQNVVQPILRKNYCITLTTEKSSQEIWASFETFKNLPEVSYLPLGENSPNLVTLVSSKAGRPDAFEKTSPRLYSN
jgi:hypothetical protein